MGNHASLLNTQERWTLVHYVQKLQGIRNEKTSDSTIVIAGANGGDPVAMPVKEVKIK